MRRTHTQGARLELSADVELLASRAAAGGRARRADDLRAVAAHLRAKDVQRRDPAAAAHAHPSPGRPRPLRGRLSTVGRALRAVLRRRRRPRRNRASS